MIVDKVVAWPSGLRHWFYALVSSEARVRISPIKDGLPVTNFT